MFPSKAKGWPYPIMMAVSCWDQTTSVYSACSDLAYPCAFVAAHSQAVISVFDIQLLEAVFPVLQIKNDISHIYMKLSFLIEHGFRLQEDVTSLAATDRQ